MQRVGLEAAAEEVAARLRDGSREALAEAYARWAPLIHTIALRALDDHHDAEDVTQQVFVSAWHSRETLQVSPAALPGWLVGIARHRIADVRTQRYRSVRDARALAATADPEQARRDEEIVATVYVRHQLDGLGEPRGEVVRMFVLQDRTHQEIADQLGLPLGTVKSHVRRGLIQLRNRLEEVSDVPS